jgi:VWFA-related protein
MRYLLIIRRFTSLFFIGALLISLSLSGQDIAAQDMVGQDKKPASSPSKNGSSSDDADDLKIFTEEVRLPVLALDEYGHYDPTLELDDILILEDGVPQEVRSVRHIPASVLLLLDTGGDGVGTGGMSKRTWTTREAARRVLAGLPQGDAISVMQFSDQVELIQGWTRDKQQVDKALVRKLHSGRNVRLAEAVRQAVAVMKERPEGSRHVVLITDGVGTQNAQSRVEDAVKELMAARVSVDIISYTQLVQQKAPYRKESVLANQKRSSEIMAQAGMDPTAPPGMNRGTMATSSGGVGITFDPAMRKKRKAYESDVRKSEQWLSTLATETGGRILLPKTEDELIDQGSLIARDIGAEYVVTYRPKRPLSEAAPGEYRRLDVAPRKNGVKLKTMKGYTAKPAQ